MVPRAVAGAPVDRVDDLAAHLPACRLPGLFRRSAADFPVQHGYLRPDPAKVAEIARRYRSEVHQRVIGVAWRSTNPGFGQQKTMPLSDWGPILRLPGVRYVALQHGDCTADIAASGADVLLDAAIDPLRDLDGFIAQVAAVDHVVCVSNTTAHVAGALGKPCIVMLPAGRSLLWQWTLRQGDRSPWYASVRLVQAERPDQWAAVARQVARRLG